jgi:putative ABC transport system permease protein
VLAVLGAGLGLLLAWSAVVALRATAPPGIPRIDSIRLDRPVLLVTLASTAFAVLISAVAPTLASIRRDLLTRLRAGSSGSGDGPRRQRARTVLLAAQCGGAVVLLVLAMMLTRSFTNLLAVDLGWDPARILSLAAVPPVPPEVQRPWALYVDWSERMVERLEATPGIERAAITTLVPFSSQLHPATLARGRGQTQEETTRWTTLRHVVSTGYFETMGITILEGRAFDASDRSTAAQLVGEARSPEAGVIIVSASTARLLWPGESALGQAIWLPDIDNVKWRRVIGVAEDVRFHGFADPPGLHVFVPWAQYPTGNPRIVVRGNSDADLVPLVRSVLQELAPGTRVDQVAPVAALAARATAQPRFTLEVVTLFSTLALVLAAVGIHGTLGYLVRARLREIGIRLALGATRAQIVRGTLRTGLLPALGGGLAGTAAAIGLARTFRSLFFGVTPVDGVSLLVGGGVLLAAALAAAIGPARLAARVDPAQALRTD